MEVVDLVEDIKSNFLEYYNCLRKSAARQKVIHTE